MFQCRLRFLLQFLFAFAILYSAEYNSHNLLVSEAFAQGSDKSSRLNAQRDNTNSNTVRIVLSSESDTQIRIAQDLADILNQTGITGKQKLRVLPIMGIGGAQNALDVMFLRGVDLAITQTDTLAHLRGQNWILYNDVFSQVHYITKLYNAEWHIIGKRSITNIRQLKGKRVNISKPGSGTYITSRNILELLQIRAKYTTFTNAVALEKLRNGELDAVAIMGGAPIESLQRISKDEGLHFIPTTFFYDDYFTTPLKNVLETFYLPSQLKHEQYPNLIEEGQPVPAVANGVVLAAYNWSLSRNVERKAKVEKFIKSLFANINRFSETGRHPKWKEISLAAKIPEWKRSDIAKKILASGPRKDAVRLSYKRFQEFLSKSPDVDIRKLSEEEKLKLYARFQQFIGSREN
ncbi:MAG: TAXI family TRAP transporter solute-binding subunit [Methyloligellaceae bacterium]